MNIIAVIVVYNKEISESATLKRIKDIEEIEAFVVDNSTETTHNKEFCETNEIRYISMNGNKGLSKAYNVVIDMLLNTDVVILLDDDTEVPFEYFDELKRKLEERPDVDIFVPIIKGKNGIIYSPNNYSFLRNNLVTNPLKEVRQNDFNAISSCMAIRMSVFEDYRYTEKLFVDEIDHCFCREQRARGRKFGILNVEIEQNFHQREKYISPDAAWSRIRIRIIDIFRHARIMKERKYIILALIKCCGLGLQIGKKSRSLGVICKALFLSCKLVIVDV